MSDQRRRSEERLHRAAVSNAHRQAPEPEEPLDDVEEEDVQGRTLEQRAMWLDAQVRDAMARGEFDNLPGAGKPIPGLDKPHDPDWWVKKLIERENISGVLPPALALRKEDAVLTSASTSRSPRATCAGCWRTSTPGSSTRGASCSVARR